MFPNRDQAQNHRRNKNMVTTEISDQIDDLMFQIDKSIRYHHRMRGFYSTAHRFFMFLVIMTISGVLSDTTAQFALIAASVIAAADLVWNPSHRARDHHILHARFSDLMIDVRTNQWDKEKFNLWEERRIRIEKDEPPIFYALEADCDNEVRRAWGRTENMVHISLWKQWTMFVLRHKPDSFVFAERKT